MISVVIPIYNTASYLRQCIESILKQTYKDFEILLVDDGSTDTSKDICLEYQSKYDNIRYLYKENSGVSSTRNYGIDNAKGRWIFFIDSDDFLLSDNVFEILIDVVNEDETNIPVFNFRYIYDDKEKDGSKFDLSSINDKEIIMNIVSGRQSKSFFGQMFRASWGKMFDKEILDKYNIRFDEKMYIGEDAIFLLDYFKVNNNLKFIDEPLYGYRYHNCSACRKYKADLLDQNLLQLDNLLKRLDSNDNDYKKAICGFIMAEYWGLISNGKKKDKKTGYNDAEIWMSSNYKYFINERFKMKEIGKRSYIYIYIFLNLLKKLEEFLQRYYLNNILINDNLNNILRYSL